MSGWLTAQLPRYLAQDPFTRRFVTIFEEIAGGIRTQVDALEYYVDTDTAPPEYVRWLGGWLDVTVDANQPPDRQRAIVREAGRMYHRRGTQEGLAQLLAAITGGDVRIVDGGGTWAAGEAPPNPGRILVRLTESGGIPDGQLHRLVAREVPIGVSFELRMGDRTITPPPAPQGVADILSMEALSAVPGAGVPPQAPPAPESVTPS
ncbi:MAG: phage tail protein [Dehalococcoidia bacterium]|nr:phage tail protein [Dehalococcoidia bacterium]